MPKVPVTARAHTFFVRPAPGWLGVTLEEVNSVAKNPLQKYKFTPETTLLKSTVKVERCDWRQGLELLLRLTTAHDVEWMLGESRCQDWSDVDRSLSRVQWDEVLPSRETPVHVSAEASHGFSEASSQLREHLCRSAGVRHVAEGAQVRLKIELKDETLRVLASLGGDALYKRGYKVAMTAVAPLPEHHAAACTRWALEPSRGETIGDVFVPFAGSGTFGFEALVVQAGSGPGAFARKFACDLFPGTPAPTMGFIRRKLAERLASAQLPSVTFNDFNDDAVAMLKTNSAAFAVALGGEAKSPFKILPGDFFELNPQFSNEGKILVLLNPPYGDRLASNSDVTKLYGRLGGKMGALAKQHPGRMVGACLCPDTESWQSFSKGLNNGIVETHHFTHGGKEMRAVRWRA